MQAASPRFYATLAESHIVVARADLLIGGSVAADLADLGIVVDGNVQVQNAAEQRSGSLTLVDGSGTLQPRAPDDLLAPVGNEIRLWRGVAYPGPVGQPGGSSEELVPIGTFRFTKSGGTYPQIDLDLHDRSWVVSTGLESPLGIAKGTNYVTAITTLLNTAWGGGLPSNLPDTDETTAAMVFDIEADPWEAARNLAGNLGMRLFFDPWGELTMIPEPDGQTIPIWTFDDADVKNLGLYGAEQGWDANEAVNAIIVIGENSDNTQTFRGTAYDTSPHSPTQYGGKFGRRAGFVRDEKVASQTQATKRAKQELRKRLGIVQTVSVPSLVNPCLEAGDVVRVRDQRAGLDQKVVIDRFVVPLRAAATMTLERTRLVPQEAI
jgi:hypothetical protein